MANALLQGYVYNDAGAAVVGATVDLLARGTTTPVLATTTTDAAGLWTISYATEGRFDIRITNGSSVRWRKHDSQVQISTLEVSTLRVRNPAFTFDYDIVPAAIVADRQLNLPLITATDTLATLGLAATFSAAMTHSADVILNDDVDVVFGTGLDAELRWSTGDASDHGLVLALGDTSQMLHITDLGAVATDWAITSPTHPNVYIHSNTTPATDYLRLGGHDGTTADIDVVGGTTLSVKIAGTAATLFTATAITPLTTDVVSLGTSALNFSDLFLDSGAVINFDSGDVTITHGANLLTIAGGSVTFSSSATFSAGLTATGQVVTGGNFTVDATTVPVEGMYRPTGAGNLGFAVSSAAELLLTATAFSPAVSDGNALGTTSLMWGDLFLASGGVLNFNAGNITLTHSAGLLTYAGGNINFGAGMVFINDTSNANMTTGLTINQGAADDEAIALKSSDVTHGVTTVAETDTYGQLQKVAGADGGLLIRGLSDAVIAAQTIAIYTTDDTTKGLTSRGHAEVVVQKVSGTGITDPAANTNMWLLRSNGNTRALIDETGDLYLDATSNANAWDDYDDIALLTAYRGLSMQDNVSFRERFRDVIAENREVLIKTGVLSEGGFVSTKGVTALIIDAIRQLGLRAARLEERLDRALPAA